MSDQPKIVKSLPNDDISRVVWWYGPVIKNPHSSEVPLAEILMKTIKNDNTLSKGSYIQKVPVSDLDGIKIGSIWKGQSAVDGMWNAAERAQFAFDFSEYAPESVRFLDKNPGTGYFYIPSSIYPLGEMNQSTRYHFLNSTMTKLRSNTGVTVLIPSLEFLTGAIAPYHKQIRYKLLLQPLDVLLDNQLHYASASIKDGKYLIRARENHYHENLTLLAYLRLNHISRSRLSRLFASTQKTKRMANGQEFEDRYPEVLPFHPKSMSLAGEGLWINQGTYLMLRIAGVSDPQEYGVEHEKNTYEAKPSGNEPPKGPRDPFHNPPTVDPLELGIDHEHGSNRHTGIAYIRSGVERIGPPTPFETTLLRKEVEGSPPPQKPDKWEEAKGLSAEDPSDRNDTKDNATSRQTGPDLVDSSGVLHETIQALTHLIDDADSQVKSFTYVNNNAQESAAHAYCHIRKKQLPEDISGRWHLHKLAKIEGTKTRYTYRNFLIVKIVLNDYKVAYLLEIERRSENEAFSGLLFSYNSRTLTKHNLINLLARIVEYKGRFSENYQSGNTSMHRKLDLPADKYLVFRHRNIQVSLKRAIKKAVEQAVFH